MIPPACVRSCSISLATRSNSPNVAASRCLSNTTEAGRLRFSVRDTGIGVDAADQKRIFHDFEQADGSVDPPLRRHRAWPRHLKAHCRSARRRDQTREQPGEGSTFSFALPLPPAHGGDLPAFVTPDLSSTSNPDRCRIEYRACADCAAPDPLGRNSRVRTFPIRCGGKTSQPPMGRCAGRSFPCGTACADHWRTHAHRRIVLLPPSARHELETLRAYGFSSYLIKPVREASLAALLSDDAPSLAPVAAPEPAPRAARSLSVLVAEDNEINALLIRALLSKLGHRPEGVTGGIGAVDAWAKAQERNEPYDLVLMDIHMPGLDGMAAARRIRSLEIENGAARTPIVALTANAFCRRPPGGACCRNGRISGEAARPRSR